jgi:2-oxoisovalerate dehydrogenase E2 component (dihydrolipoyl transacylase)
MGISAIRVPDVGEGVAEVELVEWNVKPGDVVREDDPIAAVMTDKATVEIPSIYAGTILSLGGELGQMLAVGAMLVTIEHEGEGRIDAPTPVEEPKNEPPNAQDTKVEAAKIEPLKPLAKPAAEPAIASVGARRPEGEAPLASPAVRARAREAGLDLRQIRGTGPAGRITNVDLDAVFAAPPVAPTAASRRREGCEEIRIIGLRRKIADRMALANDKIPHVTVVEEIDMTAIEDLRATMNASRGQKPKLTILPFVTAALSRALLDHPGMNAHFDDDTGVVTRHNAVHIGIATMTDGGLVVPVLRHAESHGPFATAAEIERLAKAARSGKATRDELTGSTITISSLGPLGAIATTPIINPPEVAILGINKMAVRPMWDGSQFVPRQMMNISASFDHRVIDGWDAASFVQRLKQLLESPALIFMEPEA